MRVMSYLLVALVALGGGVALQKYVLDSHSVVTDQKEAGEGPTAKKPLYWVAPMDKNYRRDKPGKSPMGMDLIPVYEDDSASSQGSVKISPVVVNNLGVRIAEVKHGDIILPIETVGYVSFDEDKLKHIHSRVDGWIEVLNVKSNGDPVKEGQTLYELYSPSLVNAQEEYLAALRSNSPVIKRASESRLLSLGVTQSQVERLENTRMVDQRISVKAQESGIVQELNVREGMFIKPAMDVMSIGSLTTVWIIAEVFERQSNWVKVGQKVNIQTDAYPGRNWLGKVDYLYPVLDKKTRTLRLRIKVDNADGTLLPNMFTTLRIDTQAATNALSIPREALIKGGNHNRVVMETGEGQYRSVLVKAGVEFGNQVQILEGLKAGDKVVTSAQFMIDSESNLDAELARMTKRESAEKAGGRTAHTQGMVKSLMLDMDMIEITHDPIPDWQWPSMTMSFTVSPGEPVPAIHAGDVIRFQLTETEEGEFFITQIEKE